MNAPLAAGAALAAGAPLAHDGPTSADALPALSPQTYAPSPLHGEQCAWSEKNCYVDIWIAVLHGLGLQPLAVMPFLVTLDFLDDQWTFFKPPHDELRSAYGIEVDELTVWRPLLAHALEHLAAGRLISTEADAFWLPDTAGTDYRRSHTKTTIVLTAVDAAAQQATYFHNTGLHRLQGEDFRGLFRTEPPATGEAPLPLFAEVIRLARMQRRPDARLRALARAALARHLPWQPQTNPVARFAQRIDADLAAMHGGDLAHYHAWAFATLRQLGAACELAASCLRWIATDAAADAAALAQAAEALQRIGDGAKTLILKGARAVNARRALGAQPLLDDMCAAWPQAMAALQRALDAAG